MENKCECNIEVNYKQYVFDANSLMKNAIKCFEESCDTEDEEDKLLKLQNAKEIFETVLKLYECTHNLTNISKCKDYLSKIFMDLEGAAIAQNAIGFFCFKKQMYEKCKEPLLNALQIYRHLKDDVNAANVLYYIGKAFFETEDYENAEKHLKESVVLYSTQKDINGITNGLKALLILYARNNRLIEAPEVLKQLSQVYKESNEEYEEFNSLWSLAIVNEILGNPHEALRYYEMSNEISSNLKREEFMVFGLSRMRIIHRENNNNDDSNVCHHRILDIDIGVKNLNKLMEIVLQMSRQHIYISSTVHQCDDLMSTEEFCKFLNSSIHNPYEDALSVQFIEFILIPYLNILGMTNVAMRNYLNAEKMFLLLLWIILNSDNLCMFYNLREMYITSSCYHLSLILNWQIRYSDANDILRIALDAFEKEVPKEVHNIIPKDDVIDVIKFLMHMKIGDSNYKLNLQEDAVESYKHAYDLSLTINTKPDYKTSSCLCLMNIYREIGNKDLMNHYSEIVNSFKIRNVKKYSEIHNDLNLVYPLTSKLRGVCLIINNFKSTYEDDIAIDSLYNLFQNKFCFKVIKYDDLEASKILEVNTELSKSEDLDAFVVIVSSIGTKDFILGSDKNIIKIENIISTYNNFNCSKLIGKPKIFIIQQIYDPKLVTISTNDLNIEPITETFSEMFIWNSTIPKHISSRITKEGSLFIQSFIEIFQKYGEDKSWFEKIKLVNIDLQRKHNKSVIQCPEISLRNGNYDLKFMNCEKKSNFNGICLIVNNLSFRNSQELINPVYRSGSEFDVLSLISFFEERHFKVKLENDLSTKAMLQTFRELSQRLETVKCDSLIVITLTHGNDGVLLGVEDEEVCTEEILRLFSDSNCQSMKGKPKLFINNACRGDNKGKTILKAKSLHPQFSDVIIWRRNVAKNDNEKSRELFYKTITKIFKENAKTTELMDLIKMVNDDIKDKEIGLNEVSLRNWNKNFFWIQREFEEISDSEQFTNQQKIINQSIDNDFNDVLFNLERECLPDLGFNFD